MSGTNAGRLAGQRILVTGAASGIGRSLVTRFVADGARVACLDCNRAALAETVEALSDSAIALPADVTNEDEVADAVAQAVEAFGGLDGAVSNAGVELAGQDGPVHELELSAWKTTIEVNLTGAFLVGKHCIRALLAGGNGGSMVFIGSPTGLYGFARDQDAYSASKAGVHGLARVMAAEYAMAGVRVNIVVPGVIDTPINTALLANANSLERFLSTVPMRRVGAPAEVAALASWLLSDEASYCTGGYYMVDGGHTAV